MEMLSGVHKINLQIGNDELNIMTLLKTLCSDQSGECSEKDLELFTLIKENCLINDLRTLGNQTDKF